MTHGPQRKLRQTLLVYPRFQLALIGLIAGMGLGVLTTILIADEILFNRLHEAIVTTGLPLQHPVFQILAREEAKMNFIYLMTGIFILVTALSFGLAFSLRVAGPILRLHRHIRQVLDGHTLEDVKFRQGDYFTELAGDFNQLMEQHRSARNQRNSS